MTASDRRVPRKGPVGLARLAGRVLPACGAAILLLAAGAHAQSNGPIRLTPPGVSDGGGSVQPSPGGQGAPASSVTPAPSIAPAPGPSIAPSTPRQGIQIQTLSQPSIETVGVLRDATGGLGFDLWEDSQRGIVLGLMRRLPVEFDSYDGRGLLRRLLLTDAAPPLGGAEHENAELLVERAERLTALGDMRGLLQLLQVVPNELVAEKLARRQVEAQLLLGDYATACANTRAHADFSDAPDFWQKSLIFCQIHGGEIAAAQLGLQLMAELPGEGTREFLAMGQRMLDGLGGLPARIAASAPDLALADLLGESLPEGFLPLEAPGFALAALRLAGLAPEERARAAEIAADRRLVGPSELTRAYKEIPFSAEQIDAALTLASSQPPVVGRALLYQAGSRSTDIGQTAEILLNAFESARAAGRYQAVVSAFAGQLQRLPATPQLAWFAATAGRGLYALGRYEQAAAWLELARREAVTSPQAQASVTLLWPYALLAGDSAADWDGSLAAWSMARNEGSGEVADMQSQLYSSFRALGLGGRFEAEAAGLNAFAGPVTPDLTNLPALRDAARAGRRGETLLLAALVLGPGGTRDPQPQLAEAVLQALSDVGLGRDARALAIEMALKAGI